MITTTENKNSQLARFQNLFLAPVSFKYLSRHSYKDLSFLPLGHVDGDSIPTGLCTVGLAGAVGLRQRGVISASWAVINGTVKMWQRHGRYRREGRCIHQPTHRTEWTHPGQMGQERILVARSENLKVGALPLSGPRGGQGEGEDTSGRRTREWRGTVQG